MVKKGFEIGHNSTFSEIFISFHKPKGSQKLSVIPNLRTIVAAGAIGMI